MKSLLKKLADLADELDLIESPEVADQVDSLIKTLPFNVKEPEMRDEVARRAKEEDGAMVICPECRGSGEGDEDDSPSPWCEMCHGSGKVPDGIEIEMVEASLKRKKSIIRRKG